MSGVSRFLSRRDKKQRPHTKAEKKPDHFGGLFVPPKDAKKKLDKDADKKVQNILERLRHYGVETMVESNAEYALQASDGDSEAAFRLLMLLQDTYEGIVQPYSPDTKLLGAVNRESVTCYLDALLFAMFARLDSFEAMLYDHFDGPRKKLAGVLRLWVNMLRTGRLIGTDVTAYLQNALAECGWEEAAKLKQQDPSEAFTFITGQLELPLLTLKMDLFHTGKEDPQDDHKFVNERVLEVAILDEPAEGSSVITLEDCLEHYFNNRIEVKRHLEIRRRNTLQSANAVESSSRSEKEADLHIEEVEMDGPGTPLGQSPMAVLESTQSRNPFDRLRPGAGRRRADSIFSQRKVEITGIDPGELKTSTDSDAMHDAKGRKLSTRTEVLMPAWQFFKLLPWYTDHSPTSDAQVAAHFSRSRPVLGICLKRYSYAMNGQATRRDTYIDIPLEIGVPNFVTDDRMLDDGPLVGNFKLMLQSVVCHRGASVHSGHYVTLCRGRASNAQGSGAENARRGSTESTDGEDSWMRFDDLAQQRISYVDIHEALKQETPYLLFYQVQPIDEDGHSIHELPSYTEATSRTTSDALPPEKLYLNDSGSSDNTLSHAVSSATSESPGRGTGQPRKSEATDFAISSRRTSLEPPTALFDHHRGRSSLSIPEGRRLSVQFDDQKSAGSTPGGSVRADATTSSIPTTPAEERAGFLAAASKIGSRRGSRATPSKTSSAAIARSRPTSAGPDSNGASRFSLNMSKLTQRMSRSDLSIVPPVNPATGENISPQDTRERAPAVSAVIPPRNESKESATSAKPLPKQRKEKSAKHEKRKSKGHHDDRDCVIM